MGIISNIKKAAQSAGTNKEKLLYVKADSKVRIRFLQEIDDGLELVFHDSYTKSVNTMCLEMTGKTCPLCGDDELRTRSMYAWSVYNLDTKKVEVALFAVNNCTPVAQFVSVTEIHNTIMDRDYVLEKKGKQQNTSFSVIAMDKQKFKNEKAKPFSKSEVLKIITKAFPLADDVVEEDDEDEEEEVTKKKKKTTKETTKRKVVIEEDDDDDDEDEEEVEYAAMDEDDDDVTRSWMEEQLEEEDIDEDEFLEFHEIASLKKLKRKTKGQFNKMVKNYLKAL